MLAELDPRFGSGRRLRRGRDAAPRRAACATVRPVCLDLRPASLAEVAAPKRVCASRCSRCPSPTRSFDTVTCLEVLEHLDDPAAAVRELARVARRAVVVSVPYEPYFRIGNVLRGKHLGGLGNHPEHVQHWNLRTFRAVSRGLGGRSADRRGVSLDHRVLPSKPTLIFLLLTAIGVARIAATYRSIAQTSDETPNIACGMQYLDLGRYDYGAFHPPLARLAMAIGPYLYGARAQKLPDRWHEGNAVLNSAPRYGKALTLARLGILPFFLLACTVVWLWGRDCWAIGARSRRSSCSPTFRRCWRTPAWPPWIWRSAPASARRCSPTRCGWKRARCAAASSSASAWRWRSSPNSPPCCCCRSCIAAITLLNPPRAPEAQLGLDPGRLLLIWGAYRFSFGPHDGARGAATPPSRAASSPRFRQPLLHALETLPVPAPQLLDGLWQVHNHVDAGHTAYLLGRHSFHGWWYFFPVALAREDAARDAAARRSAASLRCAARSAAPRVDAGAVLAP